jgi:hypothetical protein
MLRDPRDGWEPNGILRKAHELAQESDYKKCVNKEDRELKYEFYFIKIAKRLYRSKFNKDHEFLGLMDDRRIERELAAKKKQEELDALIDRDICLQNELSGNSGQLAQ